MRRGHSGGWRNENPRHFRPRNNGNPRYRGQRPFGLLDAPRFPQPGPRFQTPRYINHNAPSSEHLPDQHHDRSYQGSRQNPHRPPDRNQYPQPNRQIFPLLQRMRQEDTHYNEPTNFYDNHHNPRINNMGDMDHRQHNPPNRESFKIQPWINPPFQEDRSVTHNYNLQDNEHNKMPLAECPSAGHRPPASDHYGSIQGSTMDNSNTFSRSVDDTVSIVRKRLQRRESVHLSEPHMDPSEMEQSREREHIIPPYVDKPEQSVKRKTNNTQRIRNIKSNCDKIKSKIVHQLFMMDKDKIHKLMDNPSSSSKFEYAISSLITESQNSYNLHLRSAAEKSLCSTSTEFVHRDTNTIYEDTFMKEMQCILEPQDTILLEDIKPIVLAELCKVLQIDDQRLEDEPAFARDHKLQYNQYPNEPYEYDNNASTFSPVQEDLFYERRNIYPRTPTPTYELEEKPECSRAENLTNTPLFERRKSRRSKERRKSSSERRKSSSERRKSSSERRKSSSEQRKSSSERRKSSVERRKSSAERRRKERRSMDIKSEDTYRRCSTPPPSFDANAEHISEDDDPFAELDKQYHVVVDHNFIESYDLTSSPVSIKHESQSPTVKNEVQTPEKPCLNMNFPGNIGDKSPDLSELHKIQEELHSELQDMAKSSLKLSLPSSCKHEKNDADSPNKHIKQETPLNVTPTKQPSSVETKPEPALEEEKTPEPKLIEAVTEKSESGGSAIKSSTPSQSRKRSIDQRPSHRKEKRKKSESSPDTNKQILNKNIIINVNDCTKSSDKCDAPKSVFNLFFAKENCKKESLKDSDKYIKRKDDKNFKIARDIKESDKKKRNSSSNGHSIMSPTEASGGSAQPGPAPVKTDVQIKLKPIDMFDSHPRRASVHTAHRNTAPAHASAPAPTPAPIKIAAKPIVINRKLTRRHVFTQTTMRAIHCTQPEPKKSPGVVQDSCHRSSQTDRKRLTTRGSQTLPVNITRKIKSDDTFERMKEIDMEIQALLQEKFKLYNSLESKETRSNTMQTLGMAVLNVASGPTSKEPSISEDMIIDDFANMAELEEIALETVHADESEICNRSGQKNTAPGKRSRRLASRAISIDRKSSQSPTTKTTRSKKGHKTPNISLIEQIITDDRPLDDIICLDDLEKSPSKSTKKSQKPKKSTSKKSKSKTDILAENDIKPCSIVLIRQDLDKVIRKLKESQKKSEIANIELPDRQQRLIVPEPFSLVNAKVEVEPEGIEPAIEIPDSVLEETVLNDIQFDMLDVSEDIVIGDICEVKSSGEKDLSAHICEDIILDNSQSSVEETAGLNAEDLEECKTYDYSADENLRRDCSIITGNGDAVLAIECIDDHFLAACLDGNVYHFGSDGQLLNTLRGSNLAVTCLTIVKERYGTTVYTGSLDSRIRYYDLETGLEKGPECNVLSPIQTMDRAWDTVFVGTRTGFVLQFECKNNMLIPVSTIKFSEQCILALRAMKEGPRKVLLVAARSEAVTIKDAQTGLLLRTLEGPKMTVYTLLFEDGKVYCGTSGHQIHVFDYATGSHVYVHESGKGVVCLRALGGLLLAGCYDGCVYVYRDGCGRALAQLRGPSLMLLSLAVLGTKIIAGYKDRSLYIWKIPLGIIKEMIL